MSHSAPSPQQPPQHDPRFSHPQQGQWNQHPYPPQQKTKKNPWKWVAIGCLGMGLILVLLVAGCTMIVGKAANEASSDLGDPNAGQPSQSSTHTIKMEATSSAGASVSWALGSSTNQKDFERSWTSTIKNKDSNIWMSVAPGIDHYQNGNPQNITLSCKLTIDGKVVAQHKVSGENPTVSCDPWEK